MLAAHWIKRYSFGKKGFPEMKVMIMKYVIGAMVGTAIGGIIGYLGKCSGST